jgi:hypothetical protein
MLRLASDVDVHGAIVRGLRRQRPQIDLVRVQDLIAPTSHDTEVLAWAANEGRILITNDRNTMIGHAMERVEAGQLMPGLIMTSSEQSIGSTIADIILLAELAGEEEIRKQAVVFLPLPG